MSALGKVAALLGYEKRAEPSWPALAQWQGIGAALSGRQAESISVVFACVTAISSTLATLPVLIYQRNSDGTRMEAPEHPLAAMVRRGPNPGQTWPEFIEQLLADMLLGGNGVAEIVWNGQGSIDAIRWIPWHRVAFVELEGERLAYDVTDAKGRQRRLMDWQVLHLRDRTDNGLVGRSRLSRAAPTVQAVQTANEFSQAFLNNAAQPGGVISHEQAMSEEQLSLLRSQFESGFTGARRAGRPLILPGGLKWQASQISPEDAELLETRKFGVEEICRLFQVPPPLVQDYSHNTFTNSETAGRWFAMFCLTPLARKVEAEFARSVLQDGYEMELDLSGFLRGDPATRWQAHAIALQNGVLDPDEVRQVEGWNPRAAA